MTTKTATKKEAVAKKPAVAKKKTATKKPAVELVSYTLRAVIPTGAYANIQPEITVNAPSLEEAENVLMDHFVKLNDKYLNYSDKPKPVLPTVKHTVKAETKLAPPVEITKTEDAPISASMTRASNAVETAYSDEALALIEKQIEKSAKLTDNEKKVLGFRLVVRATKIKMMKEEKANKKG